MRLWMVALLAVAGTTFASALDEVVLKNGRRYLGTIIASTPTTIVLAIDGGTVEFPRAMVVSPPHLGPVEPPPEATPVSAQAVDPGSLHDEGPHPLPGAGEALQRLRRFPWVTEIHQVPVLVTSQGRWQFLPCVSFWAADFFQLNIFGDPARPSAIEVSLHRPPPTAWEQKRQLLEYILSIVPGMAVDNRFDKLDVSGDQFAIGDLWFEVTGPESEKTPERWAVLLLHERSLRHARASYDDLQSISELVSEAVIDTSKPRSWQRGSWLPAEVDWVRQAPGGGTAPTADPEDTARHASAFTALGEERVFVRAFQRENGKYARANTDWTREFALTNP